jgi:hypothetical protein
MMTVCILISVAAGGLALMVEGVFPDQVATLAHHQANLVHTAQFRQIPGLMLRAGYSC